MTPQQKAQEIYNKLVVHIQRYDEYVDDRSKFKTIQCALIAVEEILDEIQPFELGYEYEAKIEYWTKVKNEINKL
jgi:hypothetical protein